MKVEIQQINELGRALFTSERKSKAPKHQGELLLQEERVDYLGRSALVAALQDTRGGLREPIVPRLLDAQVIWVNDDRLRIRGWELVEDVQYNQCWDVKVLSC